MEVTKWYVYDVQGGSRVFITREDAISTQRAHAQFSVGDDPYGPDGDETALADFCCIHWASPWDGPDDQQALDNPKE